MFISSYTDLKVILVCQIKFSLQIPFVKIFRPLNLKQVIKAARQTNLCLKWRGADVSLQRGRHARGCEQTLSCGASFCRPEPDSTSLQLLERGTRQLFNKCPPELSPESMTLIRCHVKEPLSRLNKNIPDN